MPLTINAKSYVADGFTSDAVHFQGPAQTTTVVDGVIQKRYAPKPTPSSSGKSRYLFKLNRSFTLTGAKETVGAGAVELVVTVPVGISDADRDAMLTDVGTYIATAAFKAAVKTGQVNG